MAQSKQTGATMPEPKTDQAKPAANPAATGANPATGKASKAKPKAKAVMYVGPNLPGGAIMHGQLFRGGLPPMVAEQAKDIPAINDLMVPVADLPKAKRDLRDSTSALAKAYRTVATTPATRTQGG